MSYTQRCVTDYMELRNCMDGQITLTVSINIAPVYKIIHVNKKQIIADIRPKLKNLTNNTKIQVAYFYSSCTISIRIR